MYTYLGHKKNRIISKDENNFWILSDIYLFMDEDDAHTYYVPEKQVLEFITTFNVEGINNDKLLQDLKLHKG